MKKIIFIDAPTGSGKTKYITRKIEEYKAKGFKTLFLSGREMCDMIIMSADLRSRGDEDTPLLSFELEYDIIAIDDIDVSFGGKRYLEGELADFVLTMAEKGKVVMLSGIDLKNRVPIICNISEQRAEWLPINELT